MIRSARVHGASVSSITFDQTGSKVYTASWEQAHDVHTESRDRSLQCIDVQTGDAVPVLPGDALTGPLACIGDTLVSGTRDSTVVVCSPDSGGPLLALRRSPSGLSAIFGNRMILVVGSQSAELQAWVHSTIIVFSTATGESGRVTGLCASPDGLSIYAIRGKNVTCWGTAACKMECGLLDGHPKTINALSLSSDGKTLCTGGNDGTVILWDVSQLE
ncbi:WD40-repeat-containing domain protein [Blyttiomyces helicus]|uniref:WD40-repeat-containing domain protein n=1 Tax=Blyttiomyces helicus TaxID=388810 RepID=A0A4P9W308_9FUNG|nr:WD40-repeat-containing domain protein [Blyttiomyces helicus]|eukprot:RKO85208.1 WD40-repeat-containing domain protein [Blyttiomyces helicus]